MISEAVDEYIALSHTRLVKPLLNQITAQGKKKYDMKSATAQVKKNLTLSYLK